ncbi:hypothetical protein H206_06175 [Candidatus Electrothrix aarhusensis]|uniref:Uncharacterized protein n=1 Tax=Candidatus Electrothrix aarhusensis TaxID=1859131 RepID=A0A3S3QLA3_9BACT|nr:hypothetical protein H206_06175 [Candidatus Electrothrix aarhusensis]
MYIRGYCRNARSFVCFAVVLCRCCPLYSKRCAVREKKIYLFKYQNDKKRICKQERLSGIFVENPFVYMLTIR